MKKAEELVLYTPKPVRPNLDARLCVSVAEGKGQGRYIKGKTLTVAVWDKCKNPVVTWRFCGDYWIGELRKKPENNFKKDFSPKGIWEKAGKVLFWADVSATSEDSKRLHDYFNDYRENLMAVVDGALTARARKRLDKRNAQQAEETEKWFKKVPEPAEVDLKKQILTECYDAVYLWATNTKKLVVTPGGVGKYIPAQQIRCDSCGGEYTLTDRKLKHTLSMDGSVEIVRDRKKAVFSDSNFEVKSRLIAEPFLDYGKVVAQRNEGTRIALDRKELLGVLGRVKLARSADAKEKSVLVMDLEPGGTGRASMRSTIAQMNEEFSFSGKLEDPLRIGFNLEFLSEALKSMEEDEVSAWVVGPLSPVKLIEPQYEALVLPVKVRGEA